MSDIFNISVPALLSQLTIGLVNGSFYAMLSLGLAVIFGMLNIINFAHGAFYMLGGLIAWALLNQVGVWFGAPEMRVSYWWALIAAPLLVACFGMLLERFLLRRLYKLDHLYGLLLTFGLTLIIEGLAREGYGVSGLPYAVPEPFQGGIDLGFMYLPKYRAWVVIASLFVCLSTWYFIEKTKLGAYLRAGTENPALVQAFGINVPLLVTLTYGLGVGLAGLAGVMAAPIYQVSALMGANIIITVFAVVVTGGMGSILGSIITGLGLGLIEGLTKVIWPQASATVVFVVMAVVLLVRPAGLFGRDT